MKLNPCPFRPPGRQVALLTALVIVLLGLPAVTGLLRSNEADIHRLENRNMAPRPTRQLWEQNAPAYIRACEAWMGDNIGFRSRINAIYRKLRHESFQTPPQPNITLGLDGHVFLNSPYTDRPYLFFDNLCVRQTDEASDLVKRLDAVMAATNDFFQDRGAQVIFAIVPSSLALYADKLPPNLPRGYRDACVAYPRKEHALARLQRLGTESGRYRLVYPYELFAAHKNEPHFYPKERYHWEGRSAHLFTRHLLAVSGASDTPPDAPATLGPVEDDLAGFFGFSRRIEGYIYPYAGQSTVMADAVSWMRSFGDPGLLTRFETTGSLSDRTALLIANSFGGALLTHLSKGFRQLYLLDMNRLQKQDRQMDVFAAVAEQARADYVYLVFDDVNLTVLLRWLAGFVELKGQTEGR